MEATVISPPIDTARFAGEEPEGDFYLVLSRLAAYKRIDLAVEACERLGRKLVVIGDGPARRDLELLAGPNTQFLGRQDDNVVADHARRCKALIFPGEEDFGMTPIEINAAGRPVIAIRAGGATETVVEGRTGVFFDQQTPESLMAAIQEFELMTWDRQHLIDHANQFGREVFSSSIKQFVRSLAPAAAANRAKSDKERTSAYLPGTVSVVGEP